jgi:Fis1 N-terminal tetratricopeptide repeat
MRLAWALVHARQPDDVNRGIGMLEGKLAIENLKIDSHSSSTTFFFPLCSIYIF